MDRWWRQVSQEVVGAIGHDVKYGCVMGDWIDCNADLLRQDVVIKTRVVMDHWGDDKRASGPVDAWCGA